MMGPTNPTRKATTPRATAVMTQHRATALALPEGDWRQDPTTEPATAPKIPNPTTGHPDTSIPR
jgi:hypothetical protein